MSLASADSTFIGAAAGDLLGELVTPAGDVDGDGYGDILLGAPGNDDWGEDSGRTYLLFGSTLRAGTSSYDMASWEFDYAFVGDDELDYAGSAASAAGDVNGDGFGDLLLGAYGQESETGRAYLKLSPGQ